MNPYRFTYYKYMLNDVHIVEWFSHKEVDSIFLGSVFF